MGKISFCKVDGTVGKLKILQIYLFYKTLIISVCRGFFELSIKNNIIGENQEHAIWLNHSIIAEICVRNVNWNVQIAPATNIDNPFKPADRQVRMTRDGRARASREKVLTTRSTNTNVGFFINKNIIFIVPVQYCSTLRIAYGTFRISFL